MLDAVIPVVALIGLIALSVYLFGLDSTNGALQVGLFTAMSIAGLIAHKNGHSYPALGNAVIGGISSAMGAIFILLAVGALIGTWNMAGTIPTIVDYGLAAPRPELVLSPGRHHLRHHRLHHRQLLDDRRHPRRRVRRDCASHGTLAGDRGGRGDLRRLLRRQDVAALRNDHPGAKPGRWRDDCPAYSCHGRDGRPSILISLVIFFLISLTTDVAASTAEIEAARATLAEAFNISLVCLLPLVLLIAFSIIKFPAFLSIFLTAIFSGVLAIFTQPDLVIRFAGDPDLSEPLAYIKGIYAAMATGFVSSTGIEAIDSLFSRGGMSGMLSTVWLILGALGFGAIMERAGFLDKLVSSVLAKAKSGGALVATVIGTAIGLNIIAADQYIAIVLPSRMFRLEFKRRGYKPTVLSRTVEDSGTVTSVLIPWNTCGAYHTGVLGISTFAYFPYCFFNIINPILSLIYGFTGFHMEKYAPGEAPPVDEAVILPPIEEAAVLQPAGEA